MPTIKQLDTQHPEYAPAKAALLAALYTGGRDFDSRLDTLLPKRPAEPSERYALRKREAHYRNYIGPIVDYFASMLFASRATIEAKDAESGPGEFYAEFREDADGRGTDLDSVLKEVITGAMVRGVAWLRVMHPEGTAGDRGEFEARGLGDCWLHALCYEHVIDWERDAAGRLAWAVVRTEDCRRAGIDSARDTVTVRWEHLLADRIDTYAITYPKERPPHENTQVPLTASTPHRFGSVPLVEVRLPPALHIASRLESPQLAHFRLSNAHTWGLSATCYAMPVFKVEDPEEFAKTALGAGYGWTIKPTEEIEWTAPSSAPYDSLSAEVKAQKDEIFRIAHQMALGVENNSAAVGRSADSKAADAESTRVVLMAFASAVRDAIERVYDLIGAVRGDSFTWSVGGMDDFAALDVGGMVETIGVLKQQAGGVPSRTWNALMSRRIAESLLRDLDEPTKLQIRREIDENTPEPGAEVMGELTALHRIAMGVGGGEKQGADRGGSGGEPAAADRSRNGRAAPPAPAA